MSEPAPPLRIGHAERDQAVALLRDAAADGRLTLDELDERLEAALAARTDADLRTLLADLVPAGTVDAAPPARSVVAPGLRPDDPLVLSGDYSTERRIGEWEIPPFLVCKTAMGEVRLICLEARPLAAVIDVVVDGGLGTTVVVVPRGWAASVERVEKGWGSLKSEVPTTPAPGCPVFVFRGFLGHGSLTVRHSKPRDIRAVNKDRRKRGLPPLADEGRPALKADPNVRGILIPGSISVVQQLLAAGLVDELRLLVHPVAARRGRRLFDEGDAPYHLRVNATEVYPTGMLRVFYAPTAAPAPVGYDEIKGPGSEGP